MKLIVLLSLILVGALSFAQEESKPSAPTETKAKKPKKKKAKKTKTSIDLSNAVVVAQMDSPDDRYSLEIATTDVLRQGNVKTIPSLNLLKLGSDAREIASDSINSKLKADGFDTYLLVSIRGFDKRFKPGNLDDNFEKSLNQATFFELYRLNAVSVSFQIKFFQNGKCVHAEIIKCGNIADRGGVIKRYRKKLAKRLKKKW